MLTPRDSVICKVRPLSWVAQSQIDTRHGTSTVVYLGTRSPDRQRSVTRSAVVASTVDLRSSCQAGRLVLKPSRSSSCAALSFKSKLVLILACLASCAPGSSAVAATYSASSLMAAYPAWALSAVSFLPFILAGVGLGYVVHWYSERRYHAGRADQERSLKSQYKAEFAAISAARAK